MMAFFKFNIHSDLFSFKEVVEIDIVDKQDKKKRGPTKLHPVVEGKLYIYENFEKNTLEFYKVHMNKLKKVLTHSFKGDKLYKIIIAENGSCMAALFHDEKSYKKRLKYYRISYNSKDFTDIKISGSDKPIEIKSKNIIDVALPWEGETILVSTNDGLEMFQMVDRQYQKLQSTESLKNKRILKSWLSKDIRVLAVLYDEKSWGVLCYNSQEKIYEQIGLE